MRQSLTGRLRILRSEWTLDAYRRLTASGKDQRAMGLALGGRNAERSMQGTWADPCLVTDQRQPGIQSKLLA